MRSIRNSFWQYCTETNRRIDPLPPKKRVGLVDYLAGASNTRKRTRDSTLVQIFSSRHFVSGLKDDEVVEDAGEKWETRNKLQAYWRDVKFCCALKWTKFTPSCNVINYIHVNRQALLNHRLIRPGLDFVEMPSTAWTTTSFQHPTILNIPYSWYCPCFLAGIILYSNE